jgi:cAMP phosphodiesterase
VNQNLGALVLSIVTHFDHIIEVIINKGSRYRARVHETNEIFNTNKQAITTLLRNIDKLRNFKCTQVFWTSYAELSIWL